MSKPHHLQALFLPIVLLNLAQAGCGFSAAPVPVAPILPGQGAASPEQAAMRMNPPRNGEQRISVVKPAPEGALVVFENIAQQQEDPSVIEIGYAYVTLQAFGWVSSGGGGAGGQPQHSILLSTSSFGGPMDRMIIYGKVVDPRVAQVVVGFPSGQVRDTTVNGLFGMVVVPYTLVCRIELLDAEERQIGLFDHSGTAMDLAEILHGRAAQAKEACALAPEEKP